MEVPDYSFISKDTGPSLSGSINNWLTIDKNVYDLKEKQANEAIGNILQQSTDAQGNVDYGTANALAAKAGPRVQMGMQTMLQANSARRGEQITQGGTINTNIARAGASLMNDPSDANVDATIDNLIATNPGQRQLYESERQRLKAMQPQQRVQYSYQHVLGELNGADQMLHGGYGAPVMTQFGGTSAPVVSTPSSPYGPARTAVGGGIAHTVDPGTYFAPQGTTIWYDANGQVTTDPSKVARTETRDIPRGPAFGAPPPGSVGGPPPAAPGATSPPGALPPGAPPPLPGQRLVNGRFQQPPAPTQPPPATPPAATPPPVTTPPAAIPPAAVPPPPPAVAPRPAAPGVVTSSPQGQPDLLAKDNEVRTQANLAMEDQQKRLIAGNSALEALKLASTGPGTATTSRIYSFLQAQSPGGATPQGALSDTAWRQVLVKNLLRFAQSSSPRASTDQQLSTQIESNPNPEQLAPAIHHILVQDMGVLKRSIAQTQEMPTSGPAGSVVKHVGEFSTKVAPEAFMWNEYSGPERTAIEAEYAKNGQTQKLHDSLELAVRRGAIPDPRKAPAAPPAVVAPPPPAPNALVPTN